VKRELARIAAEEEARKLTAKARECSIETALDQWIAGFKSNGPTASAYSTYRSLGSSWWLNRRQMVAVIRVEIMEIE
jgi:hypothetical protein